MLQPLTYVLSYRYRLLPTRRQHTALARILEDQRQLYNAALAERIGAYQRSLLEVERKRRDKPLTITYFDQTNSLTKCRQALPEMAAVPAFLQHWTLKKLDDAYKAFFRRLSEGKRKDAGFPKFRGRDKWDSFGFSQNGGFRLIGKRLRFKGIPGGLRLHLHRPLPGDIGALGHRSEALRSITITRDPGGRKWWVSIACAVEPQRRCQSRTAAIGIDVGVAKAIVQSDDAVIPLPKTIRAARKIKTLRQRALSRARRGSKRRAKTKLRLARLEAKNTQRRKAWQHRQAARLTRCYRIIGIEDLQIANTVRSAKGTVEEPSKNVKPKAGLNRSILEVGWGGLRQKLQYKAERDGAVLIAVDPRYTSQLCSGCGAIVPKNLTQRVHHCTACGLIVDRDINAAKVIRARALAQTGSPVTPEDAELPLGRVSLAAGPDADPGNTARVISPDGGGRSPVSIPARAREPQASIPKRGGPCQSRDRQLALPLPSHPPEIAESAAGARKTAKSTSQANTLSGRGRTSYGSVD
jgi:putative transposase